jgi:hypothetical protein
MWIAVHSATFVGLMKSSLFWSSLVRNSTLLGSCLLLLFSCKNTDENIPEITEIRIDGVVVGDSTSIAAGSIFLLEIFVSDDQELEQARTQIEASTEDHTGEWDMTVVKELSGSEGVLGMNIQPPDTIRGNWILEQGLIDDHGNEAAEKIVILEVFNDILPLITVESINGTLTTETITLITNEDVMLVGSIVDPGGLSTVDISVVNAADSIAFQQSHTVIGENNWDLNAANFTLPDLNSGSGVLTISAEDTEGHSDVWTLSFSVGE